MGKFSFSINVSVELENWSKPTIPRFEQCKKQKVLMLQQLPLY
jgi:hypothetical protein